MYAHCSLTIILLIQHITSLNAALCRISNKNTYYTCEGFKFKELSASVYHRKLFQQANISNCRETSIKENEKGLVFPNIHILKISCGIIEAIDERAFANLTHLVELNLDNNALSSLPDNVFKSLNELQILSLAFNRFKTLTNEVFNSGPTNVKKLNLSYNNISTLMPKAFNKLSKLEELYLNNNAISVLTTNVLAGIANILLIDLSSNNLKSLSNDFYNTINLKQLNLSYNNISNIASKEFGNTRLEIIDLSNNNLEVVYEDIFKWSFLEELYLQNNKISMLDITGDSIATTPLRILDLRNNQLVYLDEQFLKKTKTLKALRVGSNPWDCSCYKKMQLVRGRLGLQISVEEQKGMVSICVLGENNDCKIEQATLQNYYTLYLQQFE